MKHFLFVISLMLLACITTAQTPAHCDCPDIEGIDEWFADIDPDANCSNTNPQFTLLETGAEYDTWRIDAGWNGQQHAVVIYCWTWWDGPWPHVSCSTAIPM